MKNHCVESVGFYLERRFVISAAGDFVYAKLSEIMQCYNSTFLLFSPSSVMILLAFLSFFLVFFFVKDQIASFQ